MEQNILQQCVTHGADYVDLCGEPGWMHEMINAYSDQAKETGARIVFSCGFDSIPFDLGVYFLQKEVIAQHGQPASNVRGRVRAMNGEFSGGTAASLGATMASLKEKPELFEVLINPFALSDGFTGPEQAQDSKPIYDEKLETWVAPFFMAPINTKNVHRSNVLMDHLYGEDFSYNEMWIQGPGEEGKAAAEFVGSMNPWLMRQPQEKALQRNPERMEIMMYFFVQIYPMDRLCMPLSQATWILGMAQLLR